ncbi:MAG: hypothetical protein P8Y71_21630, partial [Pseudolabrys sp.]
PIFLPANVGGEAEVLPRTQFESIGQYDEAWVQQLVHKYPSVLPIGSIEPAFTPAIPVCMELPLTSGYVDNLLITPLGDIVVVECKLWRNSEARREVIAQIIDYAKDLQKLSYDEFETAIGKATRQSNFNLFKLVASGSNEPEPPFDEPIFVDAVSQNLRRGRALLLIVGDGITENAERMTEFLQQNAGLHFALATVQLAIYNLPNALGRVVSPSIPLRTTNITRGIVQIEDGVARVSPPAPTIQGQRSSTLSEEEFFAALDTLAPKTSERLIAFLDNCADLQISWEVKKTLIVRMIVGELTVLPFVINSDGSVDTGYSFGTKEFHAEFARALSAAIPGTIVSETSKTYVVKMKARRFNVLELLENSAGCRKALEVMNKALLAAQPETAPSSQQH